MVCTPRDIYQSRLVGTDQVLKHFCRFLKESDYICAWTGAVVSQQREKWTHQYNYEVVTNTEDRDLEGKYIVMLSLIHPDDSDYEEGSLPPGQL